MMRLPLILLTLLLPGCINKTANPSATQPVTVGDPATATPEYWLEQPATDTVTARDFTTLFDAAEQVAHNHHFRIDHRDYRSGRLTTHPLVSKQWFEPWRRDVATGGDVLEASLGPIRRKIHFEFTPNPDGTFTAAPKVLVERYSRVGPEYTYAFAARGEPTSYWYTLRRDEAMERKLTNALRSRLE